MKRILSLLLALLMAFTLVACGNKPQPDILPSLDGSWTVSDRFEPAEFPPEALRFFDKVAIDSYTAVAYLGSQIVAGTNYAFLCQGTDRNLYTVIICRDPNDNASIDSEKPLVIADYNTGEISPTLDSADAAGGWTTFYACGGGLCDDIQLVFDQIARDLTDYTPLVCLGTQVTAGTNYAILCKVNSSKGNGLAVAIVYSDLSGGAELRSVNGFSIT